MIDIALKFLLSEMNGYFAARSGSSAGGVKLGRLVDDSGKVATPAETVGAALVNVEEQRVFKSQVQDAAFVNGRQVLLEPDLKLNPYVIFAANFTQYDMALQKLSRVLTFFQAHHAFTPERNSGLDPRIERLTAELVTLTHEQPGEPSTGTRSFMTRIYSRLGPRQLATPVARPLLGSAESGRFDTSGA